MSEADEKCYESRFSDLNGMKGKEHFMELGEDRLGTCAPTLTDNMAQRYLNLNPDLQKAFGRNGDGAISRAKDHYVEFGYKEGRSTLVPDWDEIWYCGDAPDSSCKC